MANQNNQFLDFEGLKQYDTNLKEYIDNNLPIERGEGENSIQQLTSTANGKNSDALGKSTFTGQKGYYINHYVPSAEHGTAYLALCSYQRVPFYGEDEEYQDLPDASEIGFEAGDVISVVNSSKYERCAIVTRVVFSRRMDEPQSYRYVELDRDLPFTEWIDVGDNIKTDDYTIFCDAKPEIGDVEIKHSQFAEGTHTIATGDAAHAEGRRSNAYGNFSHAEGTDTQAGHCAHAEGSETYAKGFYSHAEGGNTYTEGSCAHAEGSSTKAKGDRSHAEGQTTSAYGGYSHAEGEKGATYGVGSHVEGLSSNAVGDYANFKDIATNTNTMNNSWSSAKFSLARAKGSHVEGRDNLAYGDYSHAEGQNTRARAERAHAEGYNTFAYAANSHAEGESTQANGNDSHAEGKLSIAQGNNSHAEGEATRAQGVGAHAEGIKPMAIGNGSHAEGRSDTALTSIPASATEAENTWETAKNAGSNKFSMAYSNGSHVEGNNNLATGNYAHAEGDQTKSTAFATHSEGASTAATAPYAHSEGANTIAHGYYSHAEGEGTTVWPNNINTSPQNANAGHAEGIKTIAAAPGAHAEGRSTTQMRDLENFQGVLDTTDNILKAWETNKFLLARATASHAEGLDNLAYGIASHAEGQETRARGEGSHAEGYHTWAYAPYSHTGGIGTIAKANGQTVIGKYNADNNNALFIVGKGSDETHRKNSLELEVRRMYYINHYWLFQFVNDLPNQTLELNFQIYGYTTKYDYTYTGFTTSNNCLYAHGYKIVGTDSPEETTTVETSVEVYNSETGYMNESFNQMLVQGELPESVQYIYAYEPETLKLGSMNISNLSNQYGSKLLLNGTDSLGSFSNYCTLQVGNGMRINNYAIEIGDAVTNTGCVITSTYLQIGNAILTEAQLQKLIDFIDSVELT